MRLIVCRIFDRPAADIKLQITRSNRNMQNGWLWVPQLAPSWNLFQKVQAWRQVGEWPTKWKEYEEQFLREMESTVAQQYLKGIVAKVREGKTVAIGCYCTDYCHRFNVKKLLSDMWEEKI